MLTREESSLSQVGSRDADLAPMWHTALLVGLILFVAVAGTLLARFQPSSPLISEGTSRMASVYLPMIFVQWGLVLYVSRIGRGRSHLSELLGKAGWSARRMALDLGLASLGWLAIMAIMAISAVRARHLPGDAGATLGFVLPRTSLEQWAWVLVAGSSGFCEEVVYRGYLQTQFRAFGGRAGVAVLLQAALFGIAHAEQGEAAMGQVAICGLAFGAMAHWRRSLRPGILCHVWTNLVTGLLLGR
jgi:membrane protease YdiL (CAAX protease family)